MCGLQDLNVLQANAWVYWQAIEDAEIGNFWGLIQVGAMRDPWVAPGWHAAHTPQSRPPPRAFVGATWLAQSLGATTHVDLKGWDGS